MNESGKLRTHAAVSLRNDSGRIAEQFVADHTELALRKKYAFELIIANEELAFQNLERKKHTSELLLANKELAFQVQEKEMREAELLALNKELLVFNYISSHHLQEPLRKIQIFASRILETEHKDLSEQGLGYFQRMQALSEKMQQMIIDLLAYSRISSTERRLEMTNLDAIVDHVKNELHESITRKQAIIHVHAHAPFPVIPAQFQQLLHNLLSNSLKFSNPHIFPYILIKSEIVTGLGKEEALLKGKDYLHIMVEDNGIGFEPEFSERIFGVFQQLHRNEQHTGTGMGLAIVKKIVENHNGRIFASGTLNEGARFDIYIPVN